MSDFSEAIKREIKKSKQTLLYLSDISGLSLDHISKMRQGKRLPQDGEKIKKLINALQCSEKTALSLISMYKIERMGHEEWDCMQEIKKMLEYHCTFLEGSLKNRCELSKEIVTIQNPEQSPFVFVKNREIKKTVFTQITAYRWITNQ